MRIRLAEDKMVVWRSSRRKRNSFLGLSTPKKSGPVANALKSGNLPKFSEGREVYKNYEDSRKILKICELARYHRPSFLRISPSFHPSAGLSLWPNSCSCLPNSPFPSERDETFFSISCFSRKAQLWSDSTTTRKSLLCTMRDASRRWNPARKDQSHHFILLDWKIETPDHQRGEICDPRIAKRSGYRRRFALCYSARSPQVTLKHTRRYTDGQLLPSIVKKPGLRLKVRTRNKKKSLWATFERPKSQDQKLWRPLNPLVFLFIFIYFYYFYLFLFIVNRICG